MKINAQQKPTHITFTIFFKLKRTAQNKKKQQNKKYFSQMFNISSSMTVVSSVEMEWGEKLLNFLYHNP